MRRFVLVTHVTSSVGWTGAVAAFLVLSVAGLISNDEQLVRSCFVAMDLIGRYSIVPMSLAAIATGIVQSVGTQWGLFRHYWIVAKFVLSISATAFLLLHQYTAVAAAARLASRAAPLAELERFGRQLTFDAGLAVAVLVAATVLSIYKPWGIMPQAKGMVFWVAVSAAVAIAIAFVLTHLAGGGMGHHPG